MSIRTAKVLFFFEICKSCAIPFSFVPLCSKSESMTVSELNEQDRFARTNGIVLQSDGCTATMIIEERHLNGANVCQGGVLFTLADLAAAGLTHGKKLTIDSTIRFVRSGRLGDRLTAKAAFLYEGNTALIQTEIRNQSNTLIAYVISNFVVPHL